MVEFNRKYGSWAIVTGASSGIGQEFCNQLAAHKLNLILIARRKDRLEKLSIDLKNRYDIDTIILVNDLAELDIVDEIQRVTADLDVGLLVNNAGFALTGQFLEHSLDDELRMLHVNCRTTLLLTHILGRKMVEKGRGGIINVASISAFLPLPYWSHYAATKSYILHFSEGIEFELKKKGVDVLALCPGSTKTEFSKISETKKVGMNVEVVVELALRNLGKKSYIISGFSNRVITLLNKWMPRKTKIRLGAKVVRSLADNVD